MRNKTLLRYFFFLCLLLPLLSYGQEEKCQTMTLEKINQKRYPNWEKNRKEFEKQVSQYIEKRKGQRNEATVVTIPVVVHIIHNVLSGAISSSTTNFPSQQVIDQITVLNEDFRRTNADASNTPAAYASIAADVQINFCLAVRDPNGNPTTGIRRIYDNAGPYTQEDDEFYVKSLSYWPSDEYLNIWVCDLAGTALGYAQFPSIGPSSDAATDGVVIDYETFGRNHPTTKPKYKLGRTTTHEVGHWFNLLHTWADENSCFGDDGCNDVPRCSGQLYAGAPVCAAPVQCDGVPRMIQNYMDYSDDACMNLFTADQKARMQSALALSPRRVAIQSSLGCCNTCYVPHADFNASKTLNVQLNENVTFTDASTGNISTYTWNFGADAVPATATGIGPHTVYYTTDGYKSISLTTTGPYGTDTKTKNSYVQVVLPNADFFASKTSNVFIDENITFTDASTGPITTYNWNFGTDAVPPTATGIGPHTVSYTSAGTKTVTLNTTSPTSSDSETKTNYIQVVVLPPNPDFYASKTLGVALNENITFTNTSTGQISSYVWDFGVDAVPSTLTGIGPHVVSYTTSGFKTVSLTTVGPLGTATKTKPHYIAVRPDAPTELIISPNPTSNVFSLSMTFGEAKNVRLLIYDRIGKLIYDHESYANPLYHEVLDASTWTEGLYIVKLLTDDTTLGIRKLEVFK